MPARERKIWLDDAKYTLQMFYWLSFKMFVCDINSEMVQNVVLLCYLFENMATTKAFNFL